MADGRSEGEGGKVGAWKGCLRSRSGASGREGALTGGKTIKSGRPGRKATLTGVKTIRRKKGGKRRGSTSVVAVRNVNRSIFGGSTQSGTESRKVQEQNSQHQLLPGLPDDITLGVITTKLSWTDLHVLPSISHVWLHVVYTRKVHDARVRAQATESLHLSLNYGGGLRVGVHSSGEKPCYRLLPRIPKEKGWTPYVQPSLSSLFAHDGRIYVTVDEPNKAACTLLGSIISMSAPIRKSFSLDLTGRKQWTECINKPSAPRLCRSFPWNGCTCFYPCSIQMAI